MTEYATSTDIANRGLDHCGASLITSLADPSKNAVRSNAVYDKLRQTELRAHIWRHSIRSAILRPLIVGTTRTVTFPAWSSSTAYGRGNIVSSGGFNWVSPNSVTGGTAPGYSFGQTTTTAWQPYFGTAYATAWVAQSGPYLLGDLVFYPPTNVIYRAFQAVPTGTDIANTSFWTALTGATSVAMYLTHPVGVYTNGTVKNIYHLPYGYLRVANQDPRQKGTTFQRSTGGMGFSDFEFEGQYFMSAAPGPLVFRFAADVQNVVEFDVLFDEMLGATMGLALAETFTQSPQKKQEIAQTYVEYRDRAVKIDAIETGNQEQPEGEVKTERVSVRPPSPPPQQGRR